MAIGILAASEQLKTDTLNDYLVMGEIALDRSLRPIKGALPIAIQALKDGFKGFILPQENAQEAAIVSGIDVYGMSSLLEVIDFFEGKSTVEPLLINT